MGQRYDSEISSRSFAREPFFATDDEERVQPRERGGNRKIDFGRETPGFTALDNRRDALLVDERMRGDCLSQAEQKNRKKRIPFAGLSLVISNEVRNLVIAVEISRKNRYPET